MASLVLGVAGAAALGPAGLAWGGVLGMSGAQIGFIAGSTLGSMLFQPNMPDIQGPRMADLKVQASTYGTPIPIYYGTARGAGQVIWSSDLIETANEEEAGGKGGLGAPSQEYTTYTYSVNCRISVCEGEITGIRRIWANADLIYDASTGNMGPTGQSSNIRIYTGSETQMPDSLEESYLGVGNVPAYRGEASVVFEGLQLEKYGNRIPNFSFEVVSSGAITTPGHDKLTESTVLHQMPHPFIDGVYLSTSRDNGTSAPLVLHITDAIAGTDRTVNVSDIPSLNLSGWMTYVDHGIDPITLLPSPLNEIWVCVNDGGSVVAVAFDVMTLEFKREIIPTTSIGIDSVGKIAYDKAAHKVLFLTSGSVVGAGYNYLEPYSMIWDGASTTDNSVDYYTGNVVTGENSIGAANFYNYATFFSGGDYVHKVASTGNVPMIAYDTSRDRYVWPDAFASSKWAFRSVDDDTSWTVTDFAPTSTYGTSQISSFDYFPIADKFILSDDTTLYQLNADTFEIEDSWVVVDLADAIYNCMEIPSMPEYLVAFVSTPSDGLALVPLTDRLSSNTVALSTIVTDICERVELAAGDIDVTELTDNVEGYTIAQQMSARAALDGLQAAFFFDAVESN